MYRKSLQTRNKAIEDRILSDIRNFFRLEKLHKAIKDSLLREIRNFFDNGKEENYYKAVSVSNFWSNNYIEFESNSDRNKTLSVKEYRNQIRPNLENLINNLKKSDTAMTLHNTFRIIHLT